MFVCLTVDVDPDANRPATGREDAVSSHCGDSVALDACRAGLDVIAGLLEEFALPCTLFWEARTLETLSSSAPEVCRRFLKNPACEHACHGLRHEDFSGQDSGLPIGEAATVRILSEATAIVVAHTGRPPVGFRAPYCRLTPALRAAIAQTGYRYDASLTRTAGPGYKLRPYRLEGADAATPVWELALCRTRDRRGQPMTSYLWQMLEQNRTPDDYLHMAAALSESCRGGLLQIALHPWHLIVNETGAPLAHDTAADLRAVLQGVKAIEGIAFITAADYLERACRPQGRSG